MCDKVNKTRLFAFFVIKINHIRKHGTWNVIGVVQLELRIKMNTLYKNDSKVHVISCHAKEIIRQKQITLTETATESTNALLLWCSCTQVAKWNSCCSEYDFEEFNHTPYSPVTNFCS